MPSKIGALEATTTPPKNSPPNTFCPDIGGSYSPKKKGSPPPSSDECSRAYSSSSSSPSIASTARHFFGSNARYAILVISVVCLTLMMANSSALYFTVMCMDDTEEYFPSRTPLNATADSGGSTGREKGDMFTRLEQSWLFSISSSGLIFGALPFGYLVQRYGFRKIFLFYTMVCALTTGVTPFFARLGFFPLLALLLVQGSTFGIMYVSMDAISTSWSPLSESGLFLSVISSCVQLGRVISPPLGALFCETVGWPWLYYTLGAVTFSFTLLFHWIYRDYPRQSRMVSTKEIEKIELGKAPIHFEKSNKRRLKAPYKQMFKDRAVWAIYITSFGASLGNQMFVQYGPLYLHYALGYDIVDTGFVAALPYLLAIFLKLAFGAVTDRLKFLTDRWRVVFYASISQYVMAACYIGIVFLPRSESLLVQCCYNGVIMFAGLYNMGIVKNTQIIAGPYSAIVSSSTTFMLSAVKILLPHLVGLVAPDHTVEQWARIFIVTAVIQVATTTLFHFISGQELSGWARKGLLASVSSQASTATAVVPPEEEGGGGGSSEDDEEENGEEDLEEGRGGSPPLKISSAPDLPRSANNNENNKTSPHSSTSSTSYSSTLVIECRGTQQQRSNDSPPSSPPNYQQQA